MRPWIYARSLTRSILGVGFVFDGPLEVCCGCNELDDKHNLRPLSNDSSAYRRKKVAGLCGVTRFLPQALRCITTVIQSERLLGQATPPEHPPCPGLPAQDMTSPLFSGGCWDMQCPPSSPE